MYAHALNLNCRQSLCKIQDYCVMIDVKTYVWKIYNYSDVHMIIIQLWY